MIETIQKLARSGIIEDMVITYLDNGKEIRKGTMSNFNATIRSIREVQPSRKRITDEVWGMDGDYDFSVPEVYERRRFEIVLNLYEECGDRQDQRDRIVEWLRKADTTGMSETDKAAVKLEFTMRKNTYYTGLRISVGNLVQDRGGKGRSQSTLSLTITTDARYYKEGKWII